ncbi:MAG TPA: ABC transporter ATP-binding protein [Bacteroidales bacterium]|nr:ABC transporter ATP-binding protein [Bacteroidales bacterium]HRX98218.1 ABC transporter ATP-binding protein [Bacteroidales bacterium]
MTDKKIILTITKLTTGYNSSPVLNNINFSVYSDDFIGVIGPNGGGKTTLVKAILGLIKPWTGKVVYAGEIDKNGGIGYLPQINNIDRKFPISVMDVVLSGLVRKQRLFKGFSKEEKIGASQLIEEMGIGELSLKPIGELSGGQLQRVFLSRSVISNPSLLILDEPNTYVDNNFESELYEKLRTLNKKMAVIIVSHDVGMISSYVKTIACVNKELHYHESNIISEEQLQSYNCPIKLITHGDVPHTVLGQHKH